MPHNRIISKSSSLEYKLGTFHLKKKKSQFIYLIQKSSLFSEKLLLTLSLKKMYFSQMNNLGDFD